MYVLETWSTGKTVVSDMKYDLTWILCLMSAAKNVAYCSCNGHYKEQLIEICKLTSMDHGGGSWASLGLFLPCQGIIDDAVPIEKIFAGFVPRGRVSTEISDEIVRWLCVNHDAQDYLITAMMRCYCIWRKRRAWIHDTVILVGREAAVGEFMTTGIRYRLSMTGIVSLAVVNPTE